MGCLYYFLWRNSTIRVKAALLRFRNHTHRHTTLVRTPLDDGSATRRDICLITHNIHKRQTSVSPAGFEPAIPASERPQTDALDRVATGIDS